MTPEEEEEYPAGNRQNEEGDFVETPNKMKTELGIDQL